ncbi:DNA mismatch repair endonuclease MutL [Halapricum hydrolyticum]|uniref:DNA mismatch repair protein MutL n=1 Tax=Halapricum hydrolyticum TaxID=2979991 RepID=A0AAE3I9D0_9EURY|nr:DNA mismatch repair endonuclease MutL [Halapricum hydrolyticum]MCU4717304.1 DNA mismatch repair endonuclease MutL [Halapricum hydrolyticum]MCU4726231.1 DNA mismatch repair endonuclease MutL [Halapricum hydrolyticum]
MPQEIRELDPTTVERIAAGEVVERPASVVKELVENSLDADASRIRVAVASGGTESIRVSDDGVGMDEDALRQAVRQHTTSKIRDIDDLEGGLATLGFRGEALHAIGAVSRTTITSRPRDERADRGAEITVEGGDAGTVQPAGCPVGTTVEVEDLFYNVPARRKYLAQDATEFAHVNSVVTAYALANPDVAVTLEHDGREVFSTTGRGNLTETVLDVYGREVAQAMIEIDDGKLPEGPLEGVSGLVSHPETNRASREYLSTYVNGRFVTADAVREAVLEAYEGQLASDRYPFAVLFVEVDPALVDVNVHPRKMDVRFANSEGVREQITAAVEDALRREGALRSRAPRGQSAPEQTEISPGEGSNEAGDVVEGDSTVASTDASAGSRPENGPAGAPETPGTPASDGSASPAADDSDRPDTDRESSASGSDSRTGEAASSGKPGVTESDRSKSPGDSRPGTPEERRAGASEGSYSDAFEGNYSGTAEDSYPETTDAAPGGTETTNATSGQAETTDSTPSVTATEQQRFGDDDPAVQSFDSLPSMRVLGQIQDSYVVAETGDGLVLVDQHAADERINYERLREQFLGETTTQVLADAVEIELTARESALFEQFTEALSRLGFQAERIDGRTIEVRTVPSLIAEAGGPELVRDVLSSFVERDSDAAGTVEAVADELLADLACYPSVTANTSMTDGSIVSLLEALADCENPYACPHGRPVLIEIDAEEIETRFERDYPGHA